MQGPGGCTTGGNNKPPQQGHQLRGITLMLNFDKTRRTIAMTAAALALAGGATITAAGSASAAIGCTGGDGCSHQTSIFFQNQDFASAFGNVNWWGPNTVLRLQPDGNLVLYCQQGGNIGAAKWATNTLNGWADTPGAHLIFQSTGNMSLWHSYVGGSEHAVWSSQTSPPTINDRGYEAIVQADGNFVIYDASGNALWSSGTFHKCDGTGGYWG
jgi:hypothetical protein